MGKNRMTQAMKDLREKTEAKVQRRKRNGQFARGVEEPPVSLEDEERAHRAVRLLREAGGEPFCDATGALLMRRPACEGRQRNRLVFPLKSSTTTAWIARLLFDAGLPPLSRKEQSDVLQILEGQAIDQETPLTCEDVVEQDIVLYTLQCMVRERGYFHMTAMTLLQKLQEFGAFAPNDPRWPADGARLTIHLWKSRQWLCELGIGYWYQRRKGQRLHHFRPLEDVPKACLDMWMPPGAVLPPEFDFSPEPERTYAAEVSPVTPPDEITASPAPPASPAAPSATLAETIGCEKGDADDADDASFHRGRGRSEGLPDAGVQAPERPVAKGAVSVFQDGRIISPFGEDITEWVAKAMAASRGDNCQVGRLDEPDVDLDGPIERKQPRKKKKIARSDTFPDPDAGLADWYRDAEAYLNDELEL